MSGNDAIEQLRRALVSFAAERVPPLIAEAEEEALAKARKALGQEMLAALIERAGEDLSHEGVGEAVAEPSVEESPLGFYVYGVVEGEIALPDELAGVDGRHAPFPIREGRLRAVAKRV